MKIKTYSSEFEKSTVLVLGYFDCVHIGHKELFSVAKMKAKELKCQVAAMTFKNNPSVTLQRASKLINVYDERLTIFKNLGVDVVLGIKFDTRFASKSAIKFLTEVLSKKVKAVICGYDYSFGKSMEGSVEFLRDYCQKKSIELIVVDKIDFEGEKLSTSLVKKYLSTGQIDKVTTCLGRNYFADGIVVHGTGIGKQLGYPTANIKINSDKYLPKNGVYGGIVTINGNDYKSVINVGSRPTFGDDLKKIEAHLIGFNGDLYDKKVRVELNKYLRDIKKFEERNELIIQISKDIKEALSGS